MKKCLLFSLIFYCNFVFGQLNDAFTDGDFNNNPVWSGSNLSADFVVVANQLRSNSTTANASFYLSTPNKLAANCTWEFFANFKLATSGSNYVDVYLTADVADLSATNVSGYFVRIGNTEDDICLYKRTGAKSTSVKIIDGADASVSSITNNLIKIKVTRTAANVFTLERDLTGLGNSYTSEGSITDASITNSSFFGISVTQSTSSFFQKHFFDDFVIQPIIIDVTPPKLLSATVIDSVTVDVTFDEALETTSALAKTNYSVNNSVGNPNLVIAIDATKYRLVFAKGFNTAAYIVTATNVKDRNNNIISGSNTASFSFVKPYIAKRKDILINEIFADPSPQIDLPSVEFVELFNTSSQSISLKNWKYSDPTSVATFLGDSIRANEHLILCAKADTAEFKRYGKVIGLSPWPSLNNSSDVIKLVSAEGKMIDSVSYSDSWYRSAEKKSGGWSLERIDPASLCEGIFNWNASIDVSGGTPGRRNSIYQTNTSSVPLKLLSATLIDSVTLRLSFNRFIDSVIAVKPVHYSLNNGLSSPQKVLTVAPYFTDLDLKFAAAIARGNTYQVTVSNIADCSGSLITAGNNTADFFYPSKAAKGDVVINEVLFNPKPNGVDFVEIYNNSDKILDLKDLAIATTKDKDSLISVKPLSATTLLFKPKDYLVLSIDPENIKNNYRVENATIFLKLSSMPAYNDDAGVVVLLAGTNRIDQLNYNAKMHFALIKNPEGISLERTNFNRPANEVGNFRSAAATAGFATPGYKNSQASDDITSDQEVVLYSKTFSPDNDGFEDVLQIKYHFSKPGLVANTTIYNDRGVLIYRLAKNLTLANEGTLTWDGLNERSEKAQIGIYTVYMEVFDLEGNIKRYKKNCVLAAKL